MGRLHGWPCSGATSDWRLLQIQQALHAACTTRDSLWRGNSKHKAAEGYWALRWVYARELQCALHGADRGSRGRASSPAGDFDCKCTNLTPVPLLLKAPRASTLPRPKPAQVLAWQGRKGLLCHKGRQLCPELLQHRGHGSPRQLLVRVGPQGRAMLPHNKLQQPLQGTSLPVPHGAEIGQVTAWGQLMPTTKSCACVGLQV